MKIKMTLLLCVMSCCFVLSQTANAYDTPAQVPIGIAVSPNLAVEVSFPNMQNPDGCPFNGAYIIDTSVDLDARKAMLSLLLAAKTANLPVSVRLGGCTDRPKIIYVFMNANWI